MEDTQNLTLPSRINVADAADLSFTPNELRVLKAATGRTMTDLMGEDADDSDRIQAIVWLELRRRGYQPSWEDAGDVAIGFNATPEASDPTATDTSTGSQPSAASGG